MTKLAIIGRVIDERFRIVSELSEGGFGTIYVAEQIGLDRQVVVKVLSREHLHDAEALARFERESRVIASFRHKNIVSCYAHGLFNNKVPYLVFELLKGNTLRELMKSGPMPWRQVLEIGQEVCAGLAHAHASEIVHRDLKPENIFITDDNTVKILDFGLAHVSDQRLTATGELVGTAVYMSPEQSCGNPPVPQSDIYSLSFVLYEAIAGQPPLYCDNPAGMFYKHRNESPQPFPQELAVPESVQEVLFAAMAKKPEERGDALGFRETIKTVLQEKAISNKSSRSSGSLQMPNSCRSKFTARTCIFACVVAASPLLILLMTPPDINADLLATFANVLPSGDRAKYYENCGDKLTALRQDRIAALLYRKAVDSSSTKGVEHIKLLDKLIRSLQAGETPDSYSDLVVQSMQDITALSPKLKISAVDADVLNAAMADNERCNLKRGENHLYLLAYNAYDRLTDIEGANELYRAWAKAFTRKLATHLAVDGGVDAWKWTSERRYPPEADIFHTIMTIETWEKDDLKSQAITDLLEQLCEQTAGPGLSNKEIHAVYERMLQEARRRGTDKLAWQTDLVRMAYPWVTESVISPTSRKEITWRLVSLISDFGWPADALYKALLQSHRSDVLRDPYYKDLLKFLQAYVLAETNQNQDSYRMSMELSRSCTVGEIAGRALSVAVYDALNKSSPPDEALDKFSAILKLLESTSGERRRSLQHGLDWGLMRATTAMSRRSDPETFAKAFAMLARSPAAFGDATLFFRFADAAHVLDKNKRADLAEDVLKEALDMQDRLHLPDSKSYFGLVAYGYWLYKYHKPGFHEYIERAYRGNCLDPNGHDWKNSDEALTWGYYLFEK